MTREEKVRKSYKKPQVHKVKLEIDEAVLLGCKVASGNPGKGTKHCGHPTCVSLGS